MFDEFTYEFLSERSLGYWSYGVLSLSDAPAEGIRCTKAARDGLDGNTLTQRLNVHK